MVPGSKGFVFEMISFLSVQIDPRRMELVSSVNHLHHKRGVLDSKRPGGFRGQLSVIPRVFSPPSTLQGSFDALGCLVVPLGNLSPAVNNAISCIVPGYSQENTPGDCFPVKSRYKSSIFTTLHSWN